VGFIPLCLRLASCACREIITWFNCSILLFASAIRVSARASACLYGSS
jgi:hypothetical protein